MPVFMLVLNQKIARMRQSQMIAADRRFKKSALILKTNDLVNVDPENKGLRRKRGRAWPGRGRVGLLFSQKKYVDPENKGLSKFDPDNKGLKRLILKTKGLTRNPGRSAKRNVGCGLR
ncbi:MAG: hypothetical protein WBD10_10535 [Acidobacteriaceae bacterium]